MIISVLLFSLIFQCVFSNFFSPLHSIFYPLFVTSALIIIFPYFKDDNKYLITCTLYGILYDILCSPTALFHAFLFLLLGVVILLLNHQWSNNIFNNILFQIIVIFIYETISYVMISIIDKMKWNSVINFNLVGKALISNIIYIALLYYITDRLSQKYKIHKID